MELYRRMYVKYKATLALRSELNDQVQSPLLNIFKTSSKGF